MKQYPIYLDSKDNYFLLVDYHFDCEKCSRTLLEGDLFFYTAIWHNKKSFIKIICNYCLAKIQKVGLVFESKFGRIINKKFDDFVPVILSPPEFKDIRKSSFDIFKIKSDNTIDRAWRSKTYPSIKGVSIGKDIKQLPEEKDLLSTQDGIDLLEELKNSQIITGKEDKDLIEEKKNES